MPARMRLFLTLAALALCTPVVASQTPWQEIMPGVRMRLIADDVRRPDGTTMVGLEIDMPPTTKTYWRVPGETGIPTEFDVGKSTGISGATQLWPYPVVDQKDGYLDYVYYGPTVLPVALKLGSETPTIDAAVTLGVCSDICVPATASFSLPLSLGRADPAQQIRLEQAMALAPLPWTGDAQAIGAVSVAADGSLVVPVASTEIEPGSVIADMDDTGVVFGAPQKSRDGKVVTLPLLGREDSAVLKGKTVRLTFLTDMGAYETLRTIGGAPDTTLRK